MEISAGWRPLRGLRLSANGAWNKARLDDDTDALVEQYRASVADARTLLTMLARAACISPSEASTLLAGAVALPGWRKTPATSCCRR